jgi:uncharacterized protein (DUF2132 family)
MSVQMTTARVKYTAREYQTRYGPKLQAKVSLNNGEEIALWGKLDDSALASLKKDEEVKLVNDGKGWKLMFHTVDYDSGEANAARQSVSKFLEHSRWSQEDGQWFMNYLADYAQAYEFALARVNEMVEKGLLPREAIGSTATTLFLSCCKRLGK